MFSLIIPAYNEEKYLGACLDYAIRNADGCIDEIIVVDNASTDRTNEIASSYSQKHPIIKLVKETQKGLTKARQRGYKEAKGDILTYIDADTHMPVGWARHMKQEFEHDTMVGFVSGPYIYYDLPWYQQIGNWLYRRSLSYIAYLFVGYIGVGGNFAIKRSVLDTIGGFDMSIAFYGEDTDIARRASQQCKAKFILNLEMPTSARRFTGQGIIKTMSDYIINFLSQAIQHKSITQEYEDFR